MNFKRYFSLFLIGLLCLTTTACRRPDEYFYSAASLTDEQFYSAPEIIVKAAVINLQREYFTDPEDEGLKNTHVSVYTLEVREVYKGHLGDELPQEIPVKLYNGKGLTEKQYKKLENRFLLEIGQEYILGLSDLKTKDAEEEYNDPGGYVIKDEYLWTFALNEDGLYENLDRGPNHRTFDLITLKEQITALYHYESENEPVVPRYTVDQNIKDPTITAEQREQFFDLVQKWRVDAMSDFTPDQPMQLEFFKYYCAYFVTDEEKSYTDMGVHYTGAAVERIAKRFGTTYGLKDDEKVFLKAGSLRDLPLAELVQYKEEKVDGKTLVTARCVQYDFPEYRYVDWSDVPVMESYADHKRMILDGNITSGYETYFIYDFSFYTEDGKTPTQFVSYAGYSPESIEAGYQTLPEFSPPKEKPKTITLAENKKLERIANGIFYYGIQSFYPTYENKTGLEFREIVKTDLLAPYYLLTQGKKDAEKGLCKAFESGVLGGYSFDLETCRYPDYEITKIDGHAGSFWLIAPPNTHADQLFEQMLLMNAHADDVVVPSVRWLVPLKDDVYFFRIQRFTPTIDGKPTDFKELIQNDPNAVEKLLNQAQKDAKKKLCIETWNYDGGTTWYLYEEYSIVKFHASVTDYENPNEVKYAEALVIGPRDMKYETVYDAVFKGSIPI